MPTINETIQKISSFERLPNGWHYGGGHRPSADTIRNARQLLAGIDQLGLHQTDAFPGIDGEVMLTIYSNVDYYELTVEPNGEVTFLYERSGRDIEHQEGLSLSESFSKLADYEAVTWDSSGLFTNNITTVLGATSRASLSRTPATEPESPSLTTNALKKAAVQSATTSSGTIAILLGIPRSIGQFQRGLSPERALSSKTIPMGILATTTLGTGPTRRRGNP